MLPGLNGVGGAASAIGIATSGATKTAGTAAFTATAGTASAGADTGADNTGAGRATGGSRVIAGAGANIGAGAATGVSENGFRVGGGAAVGGGTAACSDATASCELATPTASAKAFERMFDLVKAFISTPIRRSEPHPTVRTCEHQLMRIFVLAFRRRRTSDDIASPPMTMPAVVGSGTVDIEKLSK
jgi:hypothetical protein